MQAFSDKEKGIVVKKLTDGFYYTFNFKNPSGIKILSERAANRLESIVQHKHDINIKNTIDHSLVKSGILSNQITFSKNSKTFSVWMHVVNACNLSCYYCYIPNLRKMAETNVIQRMSMQREDVTRIVCNLIAYCKEADISNLHVNFAGGEPTLNLDVIKYFCEQIEKIKDCVAVSYGMISNGVFETKKVVPILRNIGFSLSISIDGYESSHDNIRFQMIEKKKNGTWKQIWNNVDNLMSNGIKPYFLYTVTPTNYSDLQQFSKIVHGYNLGYRLSLERTKKPYPIDMQKQITTSLCELYKRLGNTIDYNLPISRYARFSEWNLKKKKRIACSACRNYVAIDEKGYVSSCQMGMDTKYGNINTDGLYISIMKMKKKGNRTKIANPALRDGVCTECEYYHVCAGGCPEHTMNTYGTTDTFSPWCYVYGNLMSVYLESIAIQMVRNIKSKIK